jgi:hypothetical protein
MIMTTRMFRRETSEQLENSQQPMRDVTLLLLGPNASWWRGSDAFLRRLLAFGFGLITGMTFLCVSGLASAYMAKRTWLFIALYHFMLLSGGMWQRRLSDMCKAFYWFACFSFLNLRR